MAGPWRVYGARVYERFVGGLWRVVGGSMAMPWGIHGGFMKGPWRVIGGYMEGRRSALEGAVGGLAPWGVHRRSMARSSTVYGGPMKHPSMDLPWRFTEPSIAIHDSPMAIHGAHHGPSMESDNSEIWVCCLPFRAMYTQCVFTNKNIFWAKNILPFFFYAKH